LCDCHDSDCAFEPQIKQTPSLVSSFTFGIQPSFEVGILIDVLQLQDFSIFQKFSSSERLGMTG
jgi:hypothetical protein